MHDNDDERDRNSGLGDDSRDATAMLHSICRSVERLHARNSIAVRHARLDYARRLSRAGIIGFPMRAYQTAPVYRWWQRDSMPSDRFLIECIVNRGLNYGVLCGARSRNLHVAEFTDHAQYVQWASPRRWAATFETKHGNARHVYYFLEQPLAEGVHLLYGSAPAGRVLTTGDYVAAPFNVLPSGSIVRPAAWLDEDAAAREVGASGDDPSIFVRTAPSAADLDLPLDPPTKKDPLSMMPRMHSLSDSMQKIVSMLAAAVEGRSSICIRWHRRHWSAQSMTEERSQQASTFTRSMPGRDDPLETAWRARRDGDRLVDHDEFLRRVDEKRENVLLYRSAQDVVELTVSDGTFAQRILSAPSEC